MNFPHWLTESLRDPLTKESLVPASDGFLGSNNRKYPILDGIPSLVYPQILEGLDYQMNRIYRWLAPFYDYSERIFGRILTGQDMLTGRSNIVRLVNAPQGAKLLEVSPGPGVFQDLLRSAIGTSGQLVSVDLSLPMLRQCQSIQNRTNAHLIQANGAYLPFADKTFDTLFHFGGVNLFNDPQQAVREFVRVVKPDGIVAYGDERFSSVFPDGWRKRVLTRMNPGYLRTPPAIPEGLSHVTEHEVYGGLGYLVVGRRQ